MTRLFFPLLLMLISNIGYSQSDSAVFYYEKGLLEKANGRRLESLKNFEKAQKFDTPSKNLVAELSLAYFDLRKYPQARDGFKKLLEMGEETKENYKQLLLLSFNLKQHNDVITYANKLKQLDPAEKVSYYLGKVNYDMDNYGEAIKHLSVAAKEDSENAEVPYMLAHSYADMMNYKQAIPYFLKAIELNPSRNYWVYELGLIYYAMHDDKNALKYILEAGEKGYKKDNEYLENLGIAYLNLGKLDEGVNILGEILKKKPSDLNILNMIAEAYYNKGRFKEAIEYWDQVMFYDKENAPALYMIGMSYQKNGEKEKGITLCDKAIQLDPSLTSYKQKRMNMGL